MSRDDPPAHRSLEGAPLELSASRDRPRARPLPEARFTAPGDVALDEDDGEDPFGDDDGESTETESPRGDDASDDALSAELDALGEEALAAGTANDSLADFGAAEPPAVSLADGAGEPVPLPRFYGQIVDACAETLGSLARDRALRPARERPATEARMLEQLDAILVTGPSCIDDLYRAFLRSLEPKDPWRVFGPLFALGCIDGGEPLRTIAASLAALPSDARDKRRVAAEALSLVPHPELARFATSLLASPSPVARALGVDLQGRRKALAADALAPYLADPDPGVAEAALVALCRLDQPEPSLLPAIRARMGSEDARVAWQAARLLLLWGSEEPYHAAREGAPTAARLGEKALEVFVLAGEGSDLPRIEAWLSRVPVTAGALSAIARFGHAGVWAFLTHHLADEDLSDAAAAALETLFGERVPPPRRKTPRAWREAIAEARLDLGVRYRRGEPWRVEGIVAEWSQGALTRGEIALRADELIARTGAGRPAPLDGWTPLPEGELLSLGRAARAAGGAPPAGRWR